MNKETIQELLLELKKLKSQRYSIDSKISDVYEKLLPPHYKIEEEVVDLEQHGLQSHYYFISKENKVIGEDHIKYESAILDAWNTHETRSNRNIKD